MSAATSSSSLSSLSGAAQARSEYNKDLVFAGGAGSIDVGAAASLLEAVATASAAARANNETSFAASAPNRAGTPAANLRPPLEWRYSATVECTTPLSGRKSSISSSGAGIMGGTRGIYLRGRAETSGVQRMAIKIEALRDDELPDTQTSKAAQAAMETTILLEASEDWVSVPKSFMLHGGGRSFPVVVDPEKLSSGRAHFAQLMGFVSNSGVNGYRVFTVPVTVVKPEDLVNGCSTKPLANVSFSAGAVERRFYEPPTSCTYAVLHIVAGEVPAGQNSTEIRSNGGTRAAVPLNCNGNSGESGTRSTTLSSESRMFDIHVVQIEPKQSFKQNEKRFTVALSPGTSREFAFPVRGGVTMELCIAQRWSSAGATSIERADVLFCGLKPEPTELHLLAGESCFPRLTVANHLPLGGEGMSPVLPSQNRNSHLVSTFHPKASLTTLCRPLSPMFSKLTALGLRDLLPDGRQISQLVLEYKFEVEDASLSCSVKFPGINNSVYDANVEGGPFCTILDNSKKLVMTSDIYPDKQTLTKGTYYVRAALRHDKVSVLDKLRELRCVVSFKITSIALDCYETAQAAALDIGGSSKGARGWKGVLEAGEKRALFFGIPKKSAVPKYARIGDYLTGGFTVDEMVTSGAGSDSNGNGNPSTSVPKYMISMGVPPPIRSSGICLAEKLVSKSTSPTTKSDDDKKKDKEDTKADDGKWAEDAMKELKMKALKSYLKDGKLKEFDRMAGHGGELVDDVPYLSLALQRLDADTKLDVSAEADPIQVGKVVSAADNVIARIDSAEIAVHFGTRVDTEAVEEVSTRQEFEGKRAMLFSALFRKTRALYTLVSPSDATNESRTKSYRELSRWAKLDGKCFSIPDPMSVMGETDSSGAIGPADIMLLACSREAARGRPAIALRILNAYTGICDTYALERVCATRIALYESLGWKFSKRDEESKGVMRLPAGFEPF
jgi:tripeptidyl-peptidase II